MNARTQVTIDPQLQRRAQAKAAALGISFAEYIRRLVAEDIGEPKPRADITSIFDLGASKTATDIAHDGAGLIGAAVWDEYLPERTPKPTRARQRRR